MRSKVWVFPGAMGPELESIWEEPPGGLKMLGELGEVFRLAPVLGLEASLMGLSEGVEVAKGPLIVAAFGWEPPSRSVHFELSLLSVGEGGVVGAVDHIEREEAQILEEQFARLATKKLTPKWGEQATHGLVWEEGSLDLGCATSDVILGGHWESKLPDGDGELMLRTLIDDSLNLLDGLEINQRRFDDGKPKLNLLWPHSFGFQPDLPNMALRRGNLAEFWSNEIGIQGMAKLVGYRHSQREGFRRGVHVSDKVIRGFWDQEGLGALVDRGLGQMLVAELVEEARYSLEQFDGVWEKVAYDVKAGEEVLGAIMCPNIGDTGMGLVFGLGVKANQIPFDVRAWDDNRLRNLRMNEVMAKILGG